MISAIVAVDKNWGIGYNGDLLARIPEDMKNFVHLTTGNIVVMGRKTWDSLPKKPLPNRANLIITKNPLDYPIEKDCWFADLDSAIEIILNDITTDAFIIGGGQIYEKLLPYCDRVYVTKIEKSYENVDTYFPNLDNMTEWQITSSTDLHEYKDIKYSFEIYDRM